MTNETKKPLDSIGEIPAGTVEGASERKLDERTLQEALERAGVEVESEGARVLDEAERRAAPPSSIVLDPSKVEAIREEGGFGSRIQGLRDMISGLVQATKDKIAAIAKNREEGRLISEVKSQRVENPQRVAELGRYLERQAVEKHSETFSDREQGQQRAEAQAAKLRSEGYSVSAIPYGATKDYIATKETPYVFRPKESQVLVQHLADMAAASPNAIRVFEALQGFGFRLELQGFGASSGAVLNGAQGLKELVREPNAAAFLERLSALGPETVTREFTGHLGKDETFRRLAQLAKKEAEHPFLAESGPALARVAEAFGHPLELSNLETWARLAEDEAVLEILPSLVDKYGKAVGETGRSGYGHELQEKTIIKEVATLKDANVAGEFAALIKAGFPANALGYMDGNAHSTATRNIKRAVEAFAETPGLQELMRGMVDVFGMRDVVDSRTLAQCKEFLNDVPSAPAALSLLARRGIKTRPEDNRYLLEPSARQDIRKTFDAMAEPDFEAFMTQCQQLGYRFGEDDFLPSYRNDARFNGVVQNYQNEAFRSALGSEEGQALSAYLKVFEMPSLRWYGEIVVEMLAIPDALATMQKLEKAYGYRYAAASDQIGEAYKLTEALKDQELCRKLVDPSMVRILSGQAGFDIKFSMLDAKRQVALLEKPSTKAVLEDAEAIGFAKEILGSSTSLKDIIGLAQCDPSLRPLLRRMVTEFHYSPLVLDHEDEQGNPSYTLYEEGTLKRLRDDPTILEVQGRLKQAGLEKNPMHWAPELRKAADLDLVALFERYAGSPGTLQMIWQNMEAMAELRSLYPDKVETYMEIFQKVADSPSQEVQRLKDQLLSQLLRSEHPVEDYQKIESIFIKNNVPTVGKVFNVFQVLYDSGRVDQILKGNTRLSPVLEASGSGRRYYTIYQDLLSVHIESGNRSLKEYVEVLQSGGDLLDRFEQEGLASLEEREQERLRYFVGKLETLLSRSALETAGEAFAVSASELGERIRHVREGLKVVTGQTVLERVAEMYLRPAGLTRPEELLEVMRAAKTSADSRGRAMIAEVLRTEGQTLGINEGDLLKAVNHKYIGNILQNGSVAKEFLGANSDSDSTPLDTDVSIVLPEDLKEGNAGAIRNSHANDSTYGSLLFVLKDHGRFQRTEEGVNVRPEAGKRELFKTGVLGERHYGIRTGFASTEIDFMVAKEEITRDAKGMEKLFFEIVQNGFYVPIVDIEGKIIFTPEMYDERRRAFAGVEKFDGEPLRFEPLSPDSRSYGQIREIGAAFPEDSERVRTAAGAIRSEIQVALGGLGVSLRSEFDTGILGAELLDTGSTGRYTNMPGDFDFDFSLKLDANDFPKAKALAQAINSLMVKEGSNDHEEEGGYYQLRAKGVTRIGDRVFEKPLDIDIGFASKSDLSVYGSHDAIRDKLDHIREHQGEEAYRESVANVILAKTFLKEGHAYKKGEAADGGMGGIGVENWILAHGGNMESAFRSFYDAAHDEQGNRVSIDEFRKRYRVLDAGVNIKYLGHDNFIDILKPQGYEAMLAVIEGYLEGK